jgi:hypothetical protein
MRTWRIKDVWTRRRENEQRRGMDKEIPTPLCTRDAWEELKTKPG